MAEVFEIGTPVTYRGEPWVIVEWLPTINNYLIQHESMSEFRTYVEASRVTSRLTFSLSMSDMPTNAAKLVAKLPAAKVRELIEELQKQLGEQG